MSEEKLEKELEMYRKLAAKDKKIDLASLIINALHKHHDNLIPYSQKRWAYLTSALMPPFGLFFAYKFYTSNKDDAQETAWICIVLTAASILFLILITKILISGSGT